MTQAAKKPATVADLYAIPEEDRFHELLDGVIVEKTAPTGEHGAALLGVGGTLREPFQRPPGRGGPGGWWLATDVDVLLSTGDVVRPDAVGWRRELHRERPGGVPVTARPDWICEVISSKPERDRVRKLRIYQRAAIPHYWLLDPVGGVLEVLRLHGERYEHLVSAGRGEKVRAEPFDAIEVSVGELCGDDPED